jgi:histidinol-phosphate aminotransferase
VDVYADLAAFAAGLAEAALPELSRGYTALVAGFAADDALRRFVADHGVVAALDSPALEGLRKQNRELVTGAEQRAEALMRARVAERFPEHAIVGEELGATAGNEWLWVFDPVDGTSAMVRTAIAEAFGADPGSVAFGITIAVVHGQTAAAGVIAELVPRDGGLSFGRIWRSDAPAAQRSGPVELRNAVLACTVPEIMFSTAETWSGFQALRDHTFQLVRDENCVAYGRLLGGGVDVVAERDLTLPDAAALIPVLVNAGLTVTGHHGRPIRFDADARAGEYALLAAAPALHAAALAVLQVGVALPDNEFSTRTGPHDGYARKFAGSIGPVEEDAVDEIVRLCRPDIYALKPYSSARTEGSQDASILLDANENPYPPYPATPDTEQLNRYPEPQPAALLDRFAELYDVPREQLFLSRGADESIDLLVRAFCAAGTDGILVTPPTFVMYETAAAIQGAAVHRVPLRPAERFDLDVEGILGTVAANPGTKLVFVCSPNNPTANLMRRDDVLRLASSLRGKALLVVDELYVDYSGSPSLARELPGHPNLVVVRSLSKEYSLAGERLGVAIAHPEIIGILGRIMAPYSLSRSSIRSVAAAVTPAGVAYGRANIAKILAERDRVAAALGAQASVRRIFPSDANFLLVQVADAGLLCRRMEIAGIKIRDRSGVVPDAVRISIGRPAENDAMLAVFAAYPGSV